MRCSKAREQLALYVGGDLPSDLQPELLTHLEICRECAKELADLKRSGAIVQKLADKDSPGPLPADFSDQVLRQVRAEEARGQEPDRPSPLQRWRTFLVPLAGVAAIVMLIFGGRHVLKNPGATTDDSDPVLLVRTDGEPAPWDDFEQEFAVTVEGPYRLDEWTPSSEAGVIAILHKNENMLGPDTFTFDYCGEASSFAQWRSYPWMKQREKKLRSCAGSPEQLYVAVCSMPGSSRADRKKLTESLIETYNPCLNQKKGV